MPPLNLEANANKACKTERTVIIIANFAKPVPSCAGDIKFNIVTTASMPKSPVAIPVSLTVALLVPGIILIKTLKA